MNGAATRSRLLLHGLFQILALTAAFMPMVSRADLPLGSVPYAGGTTFTVWAPHASQVFVSGTFNEWSSTAAPLSPIGNGYWSGNVPGARVGEQYRYLIIDQGTTYSKRDPNGRLVTTSTYNVGNSIIYDPTAFLWGNDASFTKIPLNQMVIYEMHIGTYNAPVPGVPGTFYNAIDKLDHIQALGATTVEVMPICSSQGLFFSGYGPDDIFAVDNRAYGGPDAFKSFVKACHARGLSVLLDVVYNHWGPWDLDLNQFDGWYTSDYASGIYFYDQSRVNSPYGPRPDYSITPVRNFIFDNLKMWVEECHVDGFRWDSTSNIDHVTNGTGIYLPDGWSLMQDANTSTDQLDPDVVNIAEDLLDRQSITAPVATGGAGFDSQWHYFPSPVDQVLTTFPDSDRDLTEVTDALTSLYNGDAYHRVVCTESNDTVSTPGAPLTVQISPQYPNGYKARKNSTLGAGLVFTAPGVPMLFQGQEFLSQKSFDPTVPLDWTQLNNYPGIFLLYQNLISLDLNKTGVTSGLRGNNISVYHQDNTAKVLAYRRWDTGVVGDDVIVVANFTSATVTNYAIGFPKPGTWNAQFNSDNKAYSPDYGGIGSASVQAGLPALDGLSDSATVTIAPYSMLIFSQH